MRPATRTPTATASATTRASRSPCACRRSPRRSTYQRSGKLVAGYLQAIGLNIKYSVMDQEILSGNMLNKNKDGKWAPDYDMFIWDWGGDPDPDFILSILLGSQIGSWSDTYYNNAEYNRLYLEQQVQLDPNKRKAIIDQMQQIVYKEAPTSRSATLKTWRPTTPPSGPAGCAPRRPTAASSTRPTTSTRTSSCGPRRPTAVGGGGLGGGAIAGIIVGVVVVVGIGGVAGDPQPAPRSAGRGRGLVRPAAAAGLKE